MIGLNRADAETRRGLTYFATDWSRPCEARCRKSGQQCPHRCNSQIPNTIAGHFVMDSNYFVVLGRPVNLCETHWGVWNRRAKRLLTLPLIEGGHLSPYNAHGYGSVVIRADRIDFREDPPRIRIPSAWGAMRWQGKVPPGLLERLPILPASYP